MLMIMPHSTQSFTLDEKERQRILNGSQSLEGSKETQLTNSSESWKNANHPAQFASESMHYTQAIPVFEYSYSQNFTKTQEDTSTFKQQVDAAPPVVGSKHDVVNIFDELEGASPMDFRPLETSTAMERQGSFASSQASIPASPVMAGMKSQELSESAERSVQTPAINRLQQKKTPAGLTQMFQSSQDTPILQHRKSTYVSMKESQQQRMCDSDHEESGDDDIDFPKIRRGSSEMARPSAAHSIMERLRERASVDSRAIKNTVQTHEAAVSSREHSPDDFVIPASAPLDNQSRSQSGTPMIIDLSDSIVTDSQTRIHIPHTVPASSQNVVRQSQPNETIQFELPSTLPEHEITVFSSPSSSQATARDHDESIDSKMLQAPAVPKSEAGQAFPVDRSLPVQFKAVQNEDAEPEYVNTISSLETGQKGKPIVLQDTPNAHSERSYELPRTIGDSILRRSVSNSLPSAATTICTSVGTSRRSKSMYTPKQLPVSVLPEFSSPVAEARKRRRSGRIPSVTESPPDVHKPRTPTRKQIVDSSLPDEVDGCQLKYPPVYRARPRKRLRTGSEIVHDSQSLPVSTLAVSSPAQPSFARFSQRIATKDKDIGACNMDRVESCSSSSLDSIDSPLTSLASEDFSQEFLMHQDAQIDTSRLRRRILVLHQGKQSYQSGELVDNAVFECDYTEDTKVHVMYDDSEEAQIELLLVCPLDLRVGDIVKVNVPKIRSKPLEITQLFRDFSTTATDIHGNTAFHARRKGTKTTSKHSIDQLCIPLNLMKPFFERRRSSTLKRAAKEEPITPSRKQRSRDFSPTQSRISTPLKCEGLFGRIAFSITIINTGSVMRDSIVSDIAGNGGRLLPQGLDELFEDSPFHDSKDIAPLRLTVLGKSLKAAIVIADQPSRRAKYLQALSLGLPCLYFSYIQDCITANTLLDIHPYLLAAGEGKINGHSILMSMTCIIPSLTTTHSLFQAIQHRRRIYDKKSIIIVIGPPEQSDTRKIHYFLAWAMCAEEITDVPTLSDAYRLFQNPEDGKHWDLVSVPHLTAELEHMHGFKGKVITSDDVVQSLITSRLCVSF